jgi:hypothetical protein
MRVVPGVALHKNFCPVSPDANVPQIGVSPPSAVECAAKYIRFVFIFEGDFERFAMLESFDRLVNLSVLCSSLRRQLGARDYP